MTSTTTTSSFNFLLEGLEVSRHRNFNDSLLTASDAISVAVTREVANTSTTATAFAKAGTGAPEIRLSLETTAGTIGSHELLSGSTAGAESTADAPTTDSAPGAASAQSSAGCLCPVCSQLAVQNAGVETLEAAWATTSTDSTSITLGTSLDLGKTFALHSNPTANHTIYLDFDGFDIASTPWENGGALSLRPFYADLTTITTQTEIQRIWQRVAEDFAPFNVNVTTQQPNVEDLRKSGTGDSRWGIRVAFTYNTNQLTGLTIANAGGGGTAYYDSFNWSTDDVTLVFNRGEYSAAATASHEVGHTLNLTHDGGSYGSNAEYYEGHGGTVETSWGTIMGAPYINADENVTTWSKGDYIGANNKQDDLSVITTNNGFSFRADDYGNSLATAQAVSGVSFSQFGVIERTSDVDVFRFDTGTGNVTLSLTNAARVFAADGLGGFTTDYLAARGANLDISANLYRADGTLVASSNPVDLLSASFNLNLDAGSYYVSVDGTGVGDPFASTPTGYTEYGSLGQYLLSGTVVGTTTPVVPAGLLISAGSLNTTEAGGTASFSLSLAAAPTADVVVSFASSDTTEVGAPASVTFTAANWATAQTVTLVGLDDTLVDGNQTATIQITASSSDAAYNALAPSSLSVTNADNDTLVATSSVAASGALVNGVTYTSAPVVSGLVSATAGSDDQRQVITEGLMSTGGGRQAKSTSSLQSYVWSFNNLQNASQFSFEGFRSANRETDNFQLQLSTNGGSTWSSLLTVSNTTEATSTVALATPITGSAQVRVLDTNRSSGYTQRDSLYVDQLLFSGNTVQAARAFDTITGSGGNGQGTTAKANASLDNAEITPFAGLLLGGGSVEPMGQTLSPFLAAANPAAPWLLSGQSLL